MTDTEQYFIQWRGSKKGPWDLAAIKEALKSGDIHSLYQIEADGRQQPLREFLEALDKKEKQAARSIEDQQQKENAQQRQVGMKLPPPVPLRGPRRPLEEITSQRVPLYPDRSAGRSRTKTMRPMPNPGLKSISFDDDDLRKNGQEEESSFMNPGSLSGQSVVGLEWRHVGMALLLLLGIVAAGIGSYAIVKMISAPTPETSSSTV